MYLFCSYICGEYSIKWMRILSELKIWPNELSNTDHTQVGLSTETIQENLTATTFNQMGYIVITV